MKASRWIPRLWALALLTYGVPAGAQYMYLDSNGDGAWSTADVMNANGVATTVDVYLITNRNRDGSDATCDAGAGAMTMNAYVVNLLAVGGTVEYANFVNRQSMPVHFGESKSQTGYKNGYGGMLPLPAGSYRLCSLTITGLAGAPAISIVDMTVGYDYTSFGTGAGGCFGHDFDNTYKLTGPNGGTDWTDVDGLGPGTGTPGNRPPVLVQPAEMSVNSGEAATEVVSATDPDAQYLELQLVAPPAFVEMTQRSSERGAASADVFAGPRVQDIGTYTVTARVSDGAASDQKTFPISVLSGPNHGPRLASLPDVVVPAGSVKRVPLYAADPDGQSLSLEGIAAPSFSSLHVLASKPGAISGYVEIAPGPCSGGGTSDMTMETSDGALSDRRTFCIKVASGGTAPTSLDSIPVDGEISCLAIGDLNRDGRNDVVAGCEPGGLYLFLAREEGGFSSPIVRPFSGGIVAVAIGDLNGDGWPDVAGATYGMGATVPIWFNSGGALTDPMTMPLPSAMGWDVLISDLNGDGRPDLAVTNEGWLSVYLSSASGGFLPRQDWPASAEIQGAAIGDFNMDGRQDVAAAAPHAHIAQFLGRGAGTFRHEEKIGVTLPFRVAAADFNWDGFTDLAISCWPPYDGNVGIRVWLGDGQGGFQESQAIGNALGLFLNPDEIVAEDMDLDGKVDLAVTDSGVGRVRLLRGHGDGTFGETRSWLDFAGRALAVGDLNGDGWPEMVASTSHGPSIRALRIWWNPGNGSPGSLATRAFVLGEGRTIPIGAGGADLTIRFEPVDGSYTNDEVDPASLTLSSEGTGSVAAIAAVDTKTAVVADQDGNGIVELPARFAHDDLAKLFGRVTARAEVTSTFSGRLSSGASFCSPIAFRINPVGPPRGTALLAPNPLNPRGVLRVTTSRAGALKVRIYDVRGHLVRTVVDQSMVEAGTHVLEIDGRNGSGEPLASGVYFYAAETANGTFRGRFAILK